MEGGKVNRRSVECILKLVLEQAGSKRNSNEKAILKSLKAVITVKSIIEHKIWCQKHKIVLGLHQ